MCAQREKKCFSTLSLPPEETAFLFLKRPIRLLNTPNEFNRIKFKAAVVYVEKQKLHHFLALSLSGRQSQSKQDCHGSREIG